MTLPLIAACNKDAHYFLLGHQAFFLVSLVLALALAWCQVFAWQIQSVWTFSSVLAVQSLPYVAVQCLLLFKVLL